MGKAHTGPLREAMLVSMERPAAVAPAVQRAAWAVAERSKDLEMLAAITARSDAPEDILEAARKRKDIVVRVAYLNRASTTRSELMTLLADESRAGVIAGICEQRSLDEQPDLVELLEKRMTDKPTRALAEAVLECDGGSPMLYARALVEMSSRTGLSRDVESRMTRQSEVIAKDPAAAEFVLLNASRLLSSSYHGVAGWVAEVIGARGVSVSTRMAIIEKTIEPVVAMLVASPPKQTGYRWDPRESQLTSLVCGMLAAEDLQPEVVETLRGQVRRTSASNALRAVDDYDPDARSAEVKARLELLDRAASTTDEAAQAAIADKATNDPEVMAALLSNPALGYEAARVAVRDCARSHPAKAVAVARRFGEQMLVELYAYAPSRVIETDKWESFADQEAAKRAVMNAASSLGSRNELDVIDRLAADDPALGSASWRAVRTVTGNWMRTGETAGKLCDYLVSAQQEVLGSDAEKWETLAVLAEDFAGSIDELVATAAAL